MKPTIACPGCRAELELPSLPTGQTVQCPRCRHVFEPGLAPPPALSKTVEVPVEKIPTVGDNFGSDWPPAPRYQPLRGQWKAPVALLLLAFSILSYGLQLYVNFERSQLVQLEERVFGPQIQIEIKIRNNRPRVAPVQAAEFERRSTNVQRVADIATVIHHLTYWPAMILIVMFMHQASWNLRILRAGGVIFSPSSVVLAFFIPFLNFLQPYMVVQELWRASDPRVTQDSRSWQQVPQARVVIVWWLAIIAAALLSLAARWACTNDHFCENSDRLLSARLWCASNIAMLIAGGTLFAIIRGIHVRQRGRHAKIYDEA